MNNSPQLEQFSHKDRNDPFEHEGVQNVAFNVEEASETCPSIRSAYNELYGGAERIMHAMRCHVQFDGQLYL